MTARSASPRRWFDRLLHLHDTPRRTAAAFALGVFFSFSPLIGLQILLSMTLAFLFKLNRVAVFLGLNANLPWFVVPWYAGATLLAARAIGVPLPENFRGELAQLFSYGLLSSDFWAHAGTLVAPFVVPYLIGPTVGAVAIAAVTYVTTAALLSRRDRRANGHDRMTPAE
jgi:uncharacterized protein